MSPTARFISSHTDHRECPPADFPEYAFWGRSNVGKSSLVNTLTNQKNLAHVSATPGKTQLINYFLIDKNWYLVDLPGYGWSKVSKTEHKKWEKMIENYLIHRPNLMCVFLLIDSRLPPQPIDEEIMKWMATATIPFVLVFTKADKQSKQQTTTSITHYLQHLTQKWEELPPHFVTSSKEKKGIEGILEFVEKTNKDFKRT